ncbi:MAG: hypothetical protein IPM50_02250 [Acidobacteriota bacterium]|nr:MAG: hypothetical protein IPM50_02250 [Acidobacteriota bacterium]
MSFAGPKALLISDTDSFGLPGNAILKPPDSEWNLTDFPSGPCTDVIPVILSSLISFGGFGFGGGGAVGSLPSPCAKAPDEQNTNANSKVETVILIIFPSLEGLINSKFPST